jgi:hypothetical protein
MCTSGKLYDRCRIDADNANPIGEQWSPIGKAVQALESARTTRAGVKPQEGGSFSHQLSSVEMPRYLGYEIKTGTCVVMRQCQCGHTGECQDKAA